MKSFGDESARVLEVKTILGVAAGLESVSSHPLAIAIRRYCEQNEASSQHGSEFEEIAGRGIQADFLALDLTAVIGNEAWLEQHRCTLDGRVISTLDTWKQQGKSVVLLATQDLSEKSVSDFVVRFAFAISDPLRPEAGGVIQALQEKGVQTWMVSGDNEVTAKAVARMVGIPETNVIAGVLPHEKVSRKSSKRISIAGRSP